MDAVTLRLPFLQENANTGSSIAKPSLLSNKTIVQSGQTMSIVQQRNILTLSKLNTTKCHLQEKIEHHRTKLREQTPNRRVMKKRLNPRANYNYTCGIFLLTQLAKVEKEIAITLESSKIKALAEDDNFFNNLQSNISVFYEKSAESLTQGLHKQRTARSRYTNEIKHPWLWSWMAVSIILQTFIVPARAYPQQIQSKYDIKAVPEKFICPTGQINGTHLLSQNHPTILNSPVIIPQVASQFVYQTHQLAANAKAIPDLIDCYWDQKTVQQKENGCGGYDCLKDVFNQIPNYGNLEIWKEWYDDIQLLSIGNIKNIFTGVTRQGREKIPPNTKIVILARSVPEDKAYHAQDLINYCKYLSILSNFKGKPVVGYYAKFFGAYFGDKLPTGYGAVKSGETRTLYHEMEYADKNISFYDLEENLWEHIPDNIIFETDLGNWASTKIAKVSHGENVWRHNLIANVDYYRAYHIGKDIYLFNPGLMPKLIDLDTLNINEYCSGLYTSRFKFYEKLSSGAKKVADEMGEKGIFTVFSHYFNKYKVSDQNPMPPINVKHFHVPDEYLDNM